MLEFVLLEDFVIDVKDGSAWISEHIIDLFFMKTLDYNFSAGQLH
jgi:hypothetical protein